MQNGPGTSSVTQTGCCALDFSSGSQSFVPTAHTGPNALTQKVLVNTPTAWTREILTRCRRIEYSTSMIEGLAVRNLNSWRRSTPLKLEYKVCLHGPGQHTLSGRGRTEPQATRRTMWKAHGRQAPHAPSTPADRASADTMARRRAAARACPRYQNQIRNCMGVAAAALIDASRASTPHRSEHLKRASESLRVDRPPGVDHRTGGALRGATMSELPSPR